MKQWSEIRRYVITGEISKRAACREYELVWHTLKKILEHEAPAGWQPLCWDCCEVHATLFIRLGYIIHIRDEFAATHAVQYRQDRWQSKSTDRHRDMARQAC